MVIIQQEFMKLAELLKSISIRQKVSGKDLLNVYKALPKVTSIRLPSGFDDSDDIQPLLLSLTDAERAEFGLGVPVKVPLPAPPPPGPEPVCQVRIHAILCANDDGSGGASTPDAVDANYI
jgi:hypothetical protein